MKLILWDGTGVCMFAKRLGDGEFRWPRVQDGVLRLSAAKLLALLEGLDWRRVWTISSGLCRFLNIEVSSTWLEALIREDHLSGSRPVRTAQAI